MMQYLFDTNILSALIRQPYGPLAKKIISLNEDEFCTSIIVACELRYGEKKKGSPQLTQKVEQLLNTISIIPLGPDVDFHYTVIRNDLEKKGKIIGANDMLIAAHALALNVILITDNENEFKRIPNLSVENWLEKDLIN